MSSDNTEKDFTAVANAQWQRIHPTLDTSSVQVMMRVRRLSNYLVDCVEQVLEHHGIENYGDYELLSVLRRSGLPVTPAALADRLLITRAGVTGRLTRLHELQLIGRVTNPDDARSSLVELTPKGTSVIDAAYIEVINTNQTMMNSLNTKQEAQLAGLLEKILLSLDDTPT